MFGMFKRESRAAEEAGEEAGLIAAFPLFERLEFALFGSILSGLLLALSFPGYSNSSLAFIALVPLMFAVQGASAKKAAWLGLLSGFVFFMVSLSWLHNLTGTVEGAALKFCALLGYAVLALYCALYFIPFALFTSMAARLWCGRKLRENIRFMFSATVVWVGSEYLRGVLFTGFPWNPLGVSQYANPPIIQIAEWGGVYLVSACIVWMNAALFITFRQYTHGSRAKRYRPHLELIVGLAPVALAVSFGLRLLFNLPYNHESVRAALVQPNIPQVAKWDKAQDQKILTRLEELTETAGRLDGIDVVIWPETALPSFVRVDPESYALVERMAKNGIPLLTGSMDVNFSGEGNTYYNSSILFGTNGYEVAKYDKQHLVPFGEYVPFPGLMRKFTPIEVDFRGGRESTLMPLEGKASFSPLICFEDTVAPLALRAVRNGARWLVNQSNGAWFDPSAQSEQHLAHAVFRCVENRVPMVRCCNTGVSCSIDAYGIVTRTLEPRISGFTIAEIKPRPVGMEHTFFTRNGNAFAKVCTAVGATVLFVLRSRGRRLRKHKDSVASE